MIVVTMMIVTFLMIAVVMLMTVERGADDLEMMLMKPDCSS